jgi:acetoin:2,6-dichlorophenolindophenol oxidoreductase subunit alpha
VTTTLPNMDPEVERGLRHFRNMLTIRAFEETVVKARLAGAIRGSVHPYIGEEAIAVGICANLRDEDYVASYHRGHGHTIARGADPAAMMLELYGRKGGTCGGKGGSMHVADISRGMLGANGVIGDGVTIAVGAAQAAKLLGKDSVVVAFFGDGGLNRGPVLESFNWAKVFNLAVLFVCEDNKFASSTRTKTVTGGPGPAARAASFGLHAETIDGNDVFAVDQVAADMVGKIRAGTGPMLLHAVTYRVRGHLATDPANYRKPEEVLRHTLLDPIVRCEAWLKHQGIDDETIARERSSAENTMAGYQRDAVAAPYPGIPEFLADIQDIGAPTWPA